jgi:UDP-N-acetyl-D-mannosaminuronic acid transferase (WecB/TagA/CpsF family)
LKKSIIVFFRCSAWSCSKSSQFLGLNIAGTEHGYTEINSTEGKNSDPIVAAINKSGCDLLLVAMGLALNTRA